MLLGNTVEKAVNASRPEMGTQITDSKQAVRDVSESQEEYCDASAQADLVVGKLFPIHQNITDELA